MLIINHLLPGEVVVRDSVMWFLVSSVVVTSLFTVYVRHQHRIAYSDFQAVAEQRDALNDEWGQLLIEENLWAFPHRIEKDASKLLSMRAPKPKEIEFVGLESQDAGVNHASR